MMTCLIKNSRVWLPLLACAGMQAAQAGSSVECNFDQLSDGLIDGQPGWEIFDKVKDSSAFSVASEVGVTETAQDKALIVKASDHAIRCVTEKAVRWLRRETAKADFDFRIVVPRGSLDEDQPVMVFLFGNSVLGETARWEVRLQATTSGDWELWAALPDEASATFPADRLAFKPGTSTRVSDWLHCTVEVTKLPESDSFSSTVRITDKHGQSIASVTCTDTTKDPATMAIWNLSRLHAGFLAAKELPGLACIDNFVLSTAP